MFFFCQNLVVRLKWCTFRKDRLMKKFPDAGLTKDMTEKEMSAKLGYYRIWDCGMYRYLYVREIPPTKCTED